MARRGWGRAIDRQIHEGGFSFCLANGRKVTAPGRLRRDRSNEMEAEELVKQAGVNVLEEHVGGLR